MEEKLEIYGARSIIEAINANQDIANTQYAYFGVNYNDFSHSAANTHYPIPIIQYPLSNTQYLLSNTQYSISMIQNDNIHYPIHPPLIRLAISWDPRLPIANLREFVTCYNSRHPDPRRVWKGGSWRACSHHFR